MIVVTSGRVDQRREDICADLGLSTRKRVHSNAGDWGIAIIVYSAKPGYAGAGSEETRDSLMPGISVMDMYGCATQLLMLTDKATTVLRDKHHPHLQVFSLSCRRRRSCRETSASVSASRSEKCAN